MDYSHNSYVAIAIGVIGALVAIAMALLPFLVFRPRKDDPSADGGGSDDQPAPGDK